MASNPAAPDRPHRLPVRVYYEDTDFAGVVYYANYLRFLERGRSELLREAGIDQGTLKRDPGVVFVVRSLAIDYLAPARFDDMLEVRTVVTRLRGASAEMGQEVWRGADCLVRASVTVACMDTAGRPRRLPEVMREGLAQFAAK
jgi:acyl-CoA thioester hydrolase